jgi:hypothetical protein
MSMANKISGMTELTDFLNLQSLHPLGGHTRAARRSSGEAFTISTEDLPTLLVQELNGMTQSVVRNWAYRTSIYSS